MTSPSAEKVEFACELCRHKLRVPAEKLGRRVRCPYCQGATGVPEDRVACERSLLEARKRTKGGTKTLATGATAVSTPKRSQPRQSRETAAEEDEEELTFDPLGAPKSSTASGTATSRTSSTRVALYQFDPQGGERPLGSTSVFHERIKLVDRRGETTVSEATSDHAGLEAVDPSTLTELPQGYRHALRHALQPRWHLWVPLALLGAVLGGRYVEEALLTPLGWLFGLSSVLLLALLLYLGRLLLNRRPALHFAKVEAAVPLGPLRFVRVSWTSRGAEEGGRERIRRFVAGTKRLGWARPGDTLAVALPRARWSRPVAVLPYHLSQHLLLGHVEPAPVDAPPALPCPRCARTGRVGFLSLLGRWGGLLALLVLCTNMVAAAVLSAHLLGVHPASLVATLAALAGLVLLVCSSRPLMRCAACRGAGRVAHLERASWSGRLAAAVLLMWFGLAPLGYVSHVAAASAPAFDDAVALLAEETGLEPGQGRAAVRQATEANELSLERTCEVAAALAGQVRANGGMPEGADPVLGMPTELAQYHAALLAWLDALAEAEGHAPRAGSRAWQRVEDAGTQLEQARQRYEATWTGGLIDDLGQAAPTLWLGPATPGEPGFGREGPRYLQALAAPTLALVATLTR